MSSTNSTEGSSRILVTNISMSTTEDSLKNFFAFCGEIRAMHLYTAENGTQEAVIKFDGESSASTACLLNNALVDNTHISIKALPAEPRATSSTSPRPESTGSNQRPTSPQAVVGGLFSSIFAAGKAVAVTVADTARQIDEKYAVTETVGHAAQTAWVATVDTASSVDQKLHLSETTNKLYKDAKEMAGISKPQTPNGSSPRPAEPAPTTAEEPQFESNTSGL